MLLKEADDIHYTARVDAGAPWAQPTRLAELSGEAGEEPGPISADGLRVVFASDRLGAWALFEATRAGEGDAFGTPVLRLELYSPHDDGNPQLSPDGLQVVFHSDRPGVGSHDLWFARRNSVDDPFDPPALIDVVSTAAEEWDPWLSPDGALLLFVRDGDIYQATAR
jgi:Tol biopolymer transport system component